MGRQHEAVIGKGGTMPKARRVLAALQRDGWAIVHTAGSDKRLEKYGIRTTFAFHENVDLGDVQLAQIARDFGYTLEELRKLV
jgi:predicted RNA binding protein YcfA (HicA-like mRNA interferase family)